MKSDRELIELFRAGKEEAFSEFYDRHRKPIYVLLLSHVRNREIAEELLQETFYGFLRNLDRLNRSPDLKPYLVRTARNLATDYLRRKQVAEKALERRAADPLFKTLREPSPGGPGDPEMMSRLLLELPDEQREAVFLKIFLGFTYREIAELTGCPEGSAVSRYRYGIEKLRASMTADRL